MIEKTYYRHQSVIMEKEKYCPRCSSYLYYDDDQNALFCFKCCYLKICKDHDVPSEDDRLLPIYIKDIDIAIRTENLRIKLLIQETLLLRQFLELGTITDDQFNKVDRQLRFCYFGI